ncbi:MAG: helix-turn-helix domain-containing protein [Alphaproteobacteria bacterium]|nr:helix-turn-helix domain-containing protein [Alphaproteobacteria bacterium]
MSKRLYPHNRVRYWSAYDLDEICALFSDTGLHIQTVRRWINKGGLQTIDRNKPTLIYGQNLIDFLKRQNSKGKCKTAFDQIYCMKCKDGRPVYQKKIVIEQHKGGFLKASGLCRECKNRMFKSYKMEDYGALKRTFHVVDVLELYDCVTPTDKTHISAQEQKRASESGQMELF